MLRNIFPGDRKLALQSSLFVVFFEETKCVEVAHASEHSLEFDQVLCDLLH